MATALEMWTGINDRLNSLSDWWLTATAYLNQRPPNGASPPYVVATLVQETATELESDGVGMETFALEFIGRAVGPTDAKTVDEELKKFDVLATTRDGGITLADPNKVAGVFPEGSRFKTLANLIQGGQDQYAPGRRWRILVASNVRTI